MKFYKKGGSTIIEHKGRLTLIRDKDGEYFIGSHQDINIPEGDLIEIPKGYKRINRREVEQRVLEIGTTWDFILLQNYPNYKFKTTS